MVVFNFNFIVVRYYKLSMITMSIIINLSTSTSIIISKNIVK